MVDLERTWFEVRGSAILGGSVGSRFGFGGQFKGSGGSRLGSKVRRTFRTFKIMMFHQFWNLS